MKSVYVVLINPAAELPVRATEKSAGLDLHACLSQPVTLKPGQFTLIPTGIAIELPAGHEGQVRPRSGLAVKHGITVLNSPGTIDEDYRGEVKVALINHSNITFTVNHGDRIAQLVIAPVSYSPVVETTTLNLTYRGTGGFGSTGV
jgi:dUTP pyrophosphatase